MFINCITFNSCNALGLIDRCIKIDTRQATKEELLTIHTADHIHFLEITENSSDNELEHISSKYDSIYIHPVRSNKSCTNT